MRTLIPLLIVLACPLMMIFMMRGMHGSHSTDEAARRQPEHTTHPPAETDRDARIAELEREVAALRHHAPAAGADAPPRR